MNIRYLIYASVVLLTYIANIKAQDRKQIQGVLYSDGTAVTITIENEKISEIRRHGDTNLEAQPEWLVAPGLIDLQINGYMGIDFSDQDLAVSDIRKATEALWAEGVTSYLPTVITNANSNLINSFERLSLMYPQDFMWYSIPGFHLEGPYISPVKGFRGAHLEKYIRNPDWEEFRDYQKASKGKIKLVTIAPELEGSMSFIQKCIENNIIVSLGHHNGTSNEIAQAVDVGACLSTHLGNGCANMINRHHNPLWPQLSNNKLSISIIADGYHLTKEEVQSFYQIKGDEQTILVSDALDLAGLTPGEYMRGERKIVLTPNVIKYPAENVLAGAASPISKCVVNVMNFTNCSLESAIKMGSTNPANLLNLNVGEIRTGKRADIILFKIENDEMVIYKTYVAGKLVYEKDY